MNTTSIMDLPPGSNPIQQPNIVYTVDDIPPKPTDTKIATNGVSLDQNTINQIVSGLQQASGTGATQLQSRDIPINKVQFIDEQVQQEYIPHSNIKKDFVEEEDDDDEDETTIVNNYSKRQSILSKFENIYSTIQMPIFISILYFLFQLPFIKAFLFQNTPFLYFKDGNINIYGQLFMSILFGVVYYFASMLLTL
jgi:hypothetical protein